MKIITFNVNGIRARLHQIEKLIIKHDPDIIGFQEIKVADEFFPFESLNKFNYHIDIFGQKGHYGVAIMSKKKPVSVNKGFITDTQEAQKRLITAEYLLNDQQKITVINGYFPQGESCHHETKFPAKKRFYADLMDQLKNQHNASDLLLIMGDFNISATDDDIGIGEKNAQRWLKTGKCSFLPEEREWFSTLVNWGLYDCFRLNRTNRDKPLYSWFDYRSKGFEDNPKRGLRIDGILATKSLYEKCKLTGIDYEIRALEKPSDHAPVWVEFDL